MNCIPLPVEDVTVGDYEIPLSQAEVVQPGEVIPLW